MQPVTLIRGANGVVAWTRVRNSDTQVSWRCSRDGFLIAVPTGDRVEAFLVAVAAHSVTLVGTINQVVQLEV